MMPTLPPLTFRGLNLDLADSAFGEMRSSEALLGDAAALRDRLDEDGYLFIRNFFDRDLIMEARAALCRRLAERGIIDPAYPEIDAVMAAGGTSAVWSTLLGDDPPVHRVVFGPKMLGFYERLLGGAVRPYDHIWTRGIARGLGTAPHCDMVYMGRGTPNVLTCWVPYGDVPLEQGGLVVLEKSYQKAGTLRPYLSRDVDRYCENHPEEVEAARAGKFHWGGELSNNAVTLREKLGGTRWLTAEWRAGDFVTFKLTMVHGGLDNHTDRIRLSTDCRYQRASEPIDERWVGAKPIGHSSAAKRGRIC
jgi:ectoine hydroxylase-related dioxygenase (phytanoyl-CoA dioxygenase family)